MTETTPTRPASRYYGGKWRLAAHVELLEFLRGLKGKVVLSGYSSELYDKLLPGWQAVPLSRGRDQTNQKTPETLWLNFEVKGELI